MSRRLRSQVFAGDGSGLVPKADDDVDADDLASRRRLNPQLLNQVARCVRERFAVFVEIMGMRSGVGVVPNGLAVKGDFPNKPRG